MPASRGEIHRAELDDPYASARAAGLRYTSENDAGISRRRAGRGWSYREPRGALIRDKDTLGRIRSLAIPPAWTDVWISADPRGHIQATGRDARGRKQYRYHASWRRFRDATKFSRLIAFGEALPRVRKQVEADLGLTGLPRQKTLATVVRLLDQSLIRIGNPEYARDNDSYGLTTLRGDHVAVAGTTVRFIFRGKSGKLHEIDVHDRRVARIIQRMQELPGQALFQYLNGEQEPQTIDSGDVNDYLQAITSETFTAKDFRTWGGTVLAVRELRDLGPADSPAALKANTLTAIDAVAACLGNTRAVCRASYVHPAILESYERGDLFTFKCATARDSLLQFDECWTLAYLKDAERHSE